MNANVLEANVRSLYFQRNIFVAFAFILSLALIVLTSFLFLKRERVIITPPIIAQEFWMDGNGVSPTYLEQFGVFLGQLLLNKSSQSASEQRAIILRHTNPSFLGMMKQRLFEEEEMLKKQDSAYTFYPIEIKVDLKRMEVKLTGDRIAFAGAKTVSSKRETYVLKFVYDGYRLFLKGVEAMERAE
jgi:conjugal transfer pilus assembly protein TraE